MRIAYLLTSLGIGGAERQVLDIAARMAARGHIAAILVLRPPLSEQWTTNLPVHHLNLRKNPLSFIAAYLRARRFLREFHPDLLHSHSFHANIFTRLLKTPTTSPVLSTIHNVYEGNRLRMLAYRLTDFLCAHSTAVSTAAAERFLRLKAVPRNKITIVPNAVDTAEFTPDRQRRVQARKEMGSGDEFIWIAIGRLTPAKDYPNLLHAFAQVLAAQPDARLCIAGQGTAADLACLQSLAQSLGVHRSMQFLGLRRDIPALLDAADAFVLSSAWEGMPLVLAEAMAMQKPVVATDAGGVRELLGDTASIVPAKSPQALSTAMLQVMQLPPRTCLQQTESALARIHSHFSLDNRVSEWESLYCDLLHVKP